MTKVEELRERLIQAIGTYGVAEDKGMPSELCETLDSLIAAANEEGCDDGWAASKMLWTRMQEWNEEWQKENPKGRSLTLLDAMDLIEWKIAKARAEGAEQERERIRKESLHYAEGEPLEGTDAESVEGDEAIAQQEMFIIPASVLAPDKENEK